MSTTGWSDITNGVGAILRFGLFLCVLVCAACDSGGRANSAAPFVVDTLATGLVRVSNDGRGVWTPDTAWRLEPDLRLGTVDGGGPEQFSQVAWILEDADGWIYILDYPAQDIRVFGPTGQYSRTIGRRGEGPGEMTSAAGLNWSPDGNLWVWARDRFSVFTPTGDFVTSYVRQTRGVIYPWNGGWVEDGRYIDWGLGGREAGSNEVTAYRAMYPIQFTPPDVYDTLPPLEFDTWTDDAGQPLAGENKGLLLAQTDDGHVWFSHTDEYTLFKRTLEGDTLLSATLPSRPVEVSSSEIDSIIRFMVERGAPSTFSPEDFIRERRLVTRVLVDNVGHVFVLPHEPNVAEGSAIDVFEESGIYLGRMPLPERILNRDPPPYVTRDHVYGVVVDELDVPFVVRWRIVRP